MIQVKFVSFKERKYWFLGRGGWKEEKRRASLFIIESESTITRVLNMELEGQTDLRIRRKSNVPLDVVGSWIEFDVGHFLEEDEDEKKGEEEEGEPMTFCFVLKRRKRKKKQTERSGSMSLTLILSSVEMGS